MIRKFEPSITKITVSSSKRKENSNSKIISSSSSNREYGRVISYKYGTTDGRYTRI